MDKEDQLIERALMGDEASFELLLRPYRQGMLNTAYRMTGNSEEAKDICQEAVIKIYKYLRSFKKGKSFKNWIYKTLINCTYDELKRKSRRERLIDSQKRQTVIHKRHPEVEFLDAEIKEKIDTFLQILSPKEKAVFLLRDINGLSIQETTAVLESSSISVRTHLSRARKKIKQEFELRYFDSRRGGGKS
jgi:RNA polymerase sigma-70 factor (ECF subfamily)